MSSKPKQGEEQYKQKCYQNQYVEDPKNKFIKVQTLTPLRCELKEFINSEKELATEHVTSHMYETIDECSSYENCRPQSVIFTHPVEREKVKQNKKFVDNSGYLFYNVTTIEPSIHTSDLVNDVHRDFCSFRRPKTQHNEYENYRSFRVVKSQK